jgi:hypothetical protein
MNKNIPILYCVYGTPQPPTTHLIIIIIYTLFVIIVHYSHWKSLSIVHSRESQVSIVCSNISMSASFNSADVYFPADPLADVDPNQYSSDNYSQWFSEAEGSFEEASKEILSRRPMIPHSDLTCIRRVPPRKRPENDSLNTDPSMRNKQKLGAISTKSDPYDMVKLVRKGWTLSKVNVNM